jgi:hypothetical protein
MSFRIKNTVVSNDSLSTLSLNGYRLGLPYNIPNDYVLTWSTTDKAWIPLPAPPRTTSVLPATTVDGVPMIEPPYGTETTNVKSIEGGVNVDIIDNGDDVTVGTTIPIVNTEGTGEELVKQDPINPTVKTLRTISPINVTSAASDLTFSSSIGPFLGELSPVYSNFTFNPAVANFTATTAYKSIVLTTGGYTLINGRIYGIPHKGRYRYYCSDYYFLPNVCYKSECK